jgi:hypothetical protein
MNTKKMCFDCLHCKVSVKSTENCRLCFCAVTAKKEKHREHYWLTKTVCKRIDDMSGKPTRSMKNFPAVALKRRPLLRKRY